MDSELKSAGHHTALSGCALPHASKYFEHQFICPCCGEGDELDSGSLDNYGEEVFEAMSCPKCGARWRNEYRLHSIRRLDSDQTAVNPTGPLAALKLLEELSWLDENPCDSEELASAKEQARRALQSALQPS
jgi:predicted RNA-binding Zn-ribbon protein involved in translation (DUF1610 family)